MNHNGGIQCIKISNHNAHFVAQVKSAHYKSNVIRPIRNIMLPKNNDLCVIQAINDANMQS